MAMIPCNYEINVAKKAHPAAAVRHNEMEHFCRIELGQLGKAEALDKFDEISKALHRGGRGEYSLTMKKVQCSAEVVRETGN